MLRRKHLVKSMEVKATTKLIKVGNSWGLILPVEVVRAFKLDEREGKDATLLATESEIKVEW